MFPPIGSRLIAPDTAAVGHTGAVSTASTHRTASPLPGASPSPIARWMLCASLSGLGLALAVAGTFLPWVVSGGVERNSYAIVGVVRRFGLLGNGFGDQALSWWPLLGPLAVVPVVGGILRWWRTAALLTLMFGLLVGVIGGGVLAAAGGHGTAGVALDTTGPVVTVVGAAVAVVGAVALLVFDRQVRRIVGSVPLHVSAEPIPGSSRPNNQYPGHERYGRTGSNREISEQEGSR